MKHHENAILEIYDVLAESMQTGNGYQTRPNPPPADATCCHRAKAQLTRKKSKPSLMFL